MKYRNEKTACSLLFWIGFFLLTAGCREIVIPGPSLPGDEETGRIAFQINLDTPELETRWNGDMTYEVGNQLEREVQKVRLVLYGLNEENTWVVKYTYDYNIRSLNANADNDWDSFEQYDVTLGTKDHLFATSDQNSFITYARPVKRGNYKMLVLINPTRKTEEAASGISSAHNLYEITAVGNALSLFEDAVAFPYADGGDYNNLIHHKPSCGPAAIYEEEGVTHGYFLMSNHQGLVDIRAEKSAGHIYDDEEQANAHPVAVNVSRMVAKASVTKGGSYAVLPAGAQFNNLKWELDILNKMSFWMRQMTFLINSSGGKGVAETVENGTDRKALYAKDPNYSDWYADNRANLDVHFMRRKTASPTPTLGKDVANYNTEEERQVAYCLENTLDENGVCLEVTSRVLVSGNYVPLGFNPGESYFLFDGNIAIKRNDMIAYAANPSTIPAALGGLAGAIAFAKNEGYTFTNAELKNSFYVPSLGYYQNGINYYKIPIRHTGEKTDDAGEAAYGYYGMVRNNHYVVEINTVKGPGTPTIEEPDNGNIAFRVQINNWKNRQQGEDIGW
ncbi:Mfa1 family fimbria major subunit [Parabacteroides sp. OttesenSCG-928-G06]|nr:Mfa1 family fimbria major subunit [Parabacteroides sp. OttesenSCG-928-K15]MDL2281739.1 Mfa1 family fimbria major subunit [Parabacteroides sp. OttesenSCG-928-G06]